MCDRFSVEVGAFLVHCCQWAAPKMPILNRVNLMKEIKRIFADLKGDLLKMGKELDKKIKHIPQYDRVIHMRKPETKNLLMRIKHSKNPLKNYNKSNHMTNNNNNSYCNNSYYNNNNINNKIKMTKNLKKIQKQQIRTLQK